MKFLDEHAVRRFLHMDALIPAMEEALHALSSGGAVQPLRNVLSVPGQGGFFFTMPASVSGQLGAKLVTFYPENKGVHTHHALIMLFRQETGEPLAVMDGRLITEMRTAAVSAVATRLLARKDARSLAILGSGVQARSHLEALRLVRPFEQVSVWSPNHGEAFAREHGVRAAASAEDAVLGADVIVVATTSRTPVLQGSWLSPGVHINTVGAPRPDWRELDDEALGRCRLYVEAREAASRESGDVIAAGHIFAELGEVIDGSRPGRQHADDITLFKSVGVAVEDIAAAGLVYRASMDAAQAQ
ncbi:ornithine cyclodeaminase family protein [Variovorax sp. dw_308]|uniref:ornithine cyclodeaminase family protein n=1 Tax=Variovorax sp. dw_308 TaxID=2721546 RepID=UPI001C45F708|nr:ornithine cyclodeaminase family protein [Variovorax sp. dw_308]